MTFIVEKSDITINLAVKQADGTAYNLTGASIRVAVYQQKQRIIQLFEDSQVTRVSVSGGTIKVFLDRDNTENLEPGKMLYAELELSVSDSNFESSTGVLKTTDIELGIIKNSVM